MNVNLTMSVRDVMRELGVSRPMAYRLTAQPGFPVIRAGKRLLIPRRAFEQWLADNVGKNVFRDGTNTKE